MTVGRVSFFQSELMEIILTYVSTPTALENVEHKEVALKNREVKLLSYKKEPHHHSVDLLNECLQMLY